MVTDSTLLKESATYQGQIYTFNKIDVFKLPKEFCSKYAIVDGSRFEINSIGADGFHFRIIRDDKTVRG